jgi:hypothetical protein
VTVTLGQSGLDERERACRNCPAMHAVQQADPFEQREVAPHRLGGDAELIGDGADGDPPPFADQGGDGVLSLFGVHRTTLLRRREPGAVDA